MPAESGATSELEWVDTEDQTHLASSRRKTSSARNSGHPHKNEGLGQQQSGLLAYFVAASNIVLVAASTRWEVPRPYLVW